MMQINFIGNFMKTLILTLTISLLFSLSLFAEVMTVYMSPTCGCCAKWIEGVEQQMDIKIKAVNVSDVNKYKTKYAIAPKYAACHTGVLGNYAIEGHVPVSALKRLLKEKPKDVYALTVPGMPTGSLGMEYGDRKDKYNVIALRKDGSQYIFEEH